MHFIVSQSFCNLIIGAKKASELAHLLSANDYIVTIGAIAPQGF